MPLIKCPDCSTEVSDQAPACPKCGRPMSRGMPPQASDEGQSRPEGAKNALRIAVDAGVRMALISGGFTFLLLCIYHAAEHSSSIYWALNSVWESIGSIIGYSLLVGLGIGVVGAPFAVVVAWRRGDED